MTGEINFYPLSHDLVGKHVFGDKRHIKYTKSFLKSVTGFSDDLLEDMIITNGETLTKNSIYDKTFETDIKIRLKNDLNIILEIQNKNDIKTEIKNIMYSMNEFVTQIKRGDSYNKVKPILQIIVINDDKLRRNLKTKLTNICKLSSIDNNEYVLLENYYTIKIVDIKGEIDYVNENEELINWIKMFKAKNKNELDLASKANSLLEGVKEIMENFMNEGWVRTYKEKEADYRRIEREEMRDEIKDEIKEEMKDEIKEEMIKTLLLNTKLSYDKISLCVDVSLEKVKEVEKNIKYRDKM